MTHPLHPLPNRLARLLVQSPDKDLALKVERYLSTHSAGHYDTIHSWLDDSENLEMRNKLGGEVCELIEAGNMAGLED